MAVRYANAEDAALALFEQVSAPGRQRMLALIADAFVANIPEDALWERLAPVIDALSARALTELAERFDPPSAGDWFRDGLKRLIAHRGPGRREAARLICRQHIKDAVCEESCGPVGEPAADVIVQVCEQLEHEHAERLLSALSAVYARELAGSCN